MTVHIPFPSLSGPDVSIALWREAFPSFAALLDKGEPPLRAIRYLGLSLWGEGRLEDAAEVMRTLAGMAPGEAAVLGELGSILCALGRNDEALPFLIQSLQINPDQLLPWLNIASLCVASGDHAMALHAYQAAINLDPASTEAITGLGLLHMNARRFDEAAKVLGDAIERGAQTTSIHACLGQCLYNIGDFDGAERALAHAATALGHEGVIAEKYALVCLINALAIHGDVARAVDACMAAASHTAADLSKMKRTAFQVLSAYGYHQAALSLGAAILADNPDNPVIRYHMEALAGQPHTKAPQDYLTACFDTYAPDFDRHLVEVLDYHIPEQLGALLTQTGRQFDSVLDLGCGTGLAAPFLRPVSTILVGVDISSGMIAEASKIGHYDQLAVREALDYLGDTQVSFDLVVALDMLVYMGDLAPLIEAMAQRIRPGGLLAFTFETGEKDGYTILASGRFAHTPAFVARVCVPFFHELSSVETPLRLEANRPVDGRLVLMQRR